MVLDFQCRFERFLAQGMRLKREEARDWTLDLTGVSGYSFS